MKTFKKHLKEKQKNSQFQKAYEKEKRLVEIAIKIAEARESFGYSQQELAKKAQITQQQLSKIENGINCNINTFLKVCDALSLRLELTR